MGNFNFKIPDKLHKKFKISCLKKGKDMRDVLVELIQEDVKKNE